MRRENDLPDARERRIRRQRFRIECVEAGAEKLAIFGRRNKCPPVNQIAACSGDENGTALHAGKYCAVAPNAGAGEAVQENHVGLRKQVVEMRRLHIGKIRAFAAMCGDLSA